MRARSGPEGEPVAHFAHATDHDPNRSTTFDVERSGELDWAYLEEEPEL